MRLLAVALASGWGCSDAEPIPLPPYSQLSQTGLYSNINRRELAPEAREFAPAYTLWSDGALKGRWLLLPDDSTIDTSDMDHWVFPVGTRLFKDFSTADTIMETRLIQRIGDTGHGEQDYWMGAFLWRSDGSDADFVFEGADNVFGTEHDVPAAEKCWACHEGEPGRVLGLSAMLTSSADVPLSISRLASEGLLSTEMAATIDLSVPGEGVSQQALGYIHVNCGPCHNPNGAARPDTDMELRLLVADRSPDATTIHRSTVGMDLTKPMGSVTKRVTPGDPNASGLLTVMMVRDGPQGDQMPPLATEVVDEAAVTAVATWIESLSGL